MSDKRKRHAIEIPEITRVEGHAAVYVDIVEDRVESVQMDVFEGTRFFERLVVGHHFREIPHVTSRVCAICSTGHVIAAIRAVEKIAAFKPSHLVELYRELMHLGMIIESNATHIFALALPDFLGFEDVYSFATKHKEEFSMWTRLRKLGATIQSTVGGRPFHPVNLQAGGFSSFPSDKSMKILTSMLDQSTDLAVDTCKILMRYQPPVSRTSQPVFLALAPGERYGYFGDTIKSNQGFTADIEEYRQYLKEESVQYSHAKRSSMDGQPIMVGSMARLSMFSDLLSEHALSIFKKTALARGDTNSIWNNLAQAIEIVEAVYRAKQIIEEVSQSSDDTKVSLTELVNLKGHATGAVECPRGTLYHEYELNDSGNVESANMITPSAQNTYRIERDIQEVVSQSIDQTKDDDARSRLQTNLETLIRAYDPCNTCAAHMVSVRYPDRESTGSD